MLSYSLDNYEWLDFYNCSHKVYPDGTEQYMYSERERRVLHDKKDAVKDGSSVERGEVFNRKQAMQRVYDLARSNNWDWFLTMTFDGSTVDRYSYDDCVNALKRWTDIMYHQGNKWLIVPEQHKDGAYHFHGLVSGRLKLTPGINPYTGKEILDKSGRPVYNVTNYRYGFTTVTSVSDSKKASGYLSKYLSKSLQVPKGKKRYWASKSLQRPAVEYLVLTREEFKALTIHAIYSKDIITDQFGTFYFREI